MRAPSATLILVGCALAMRIASVQPGSAQPARRLRASLTLPSPPLSSTSPPPVTSNPASSQARAVDLMFNARQHRFQQQSVSKFDPDAIAAAALAAASGAPQLPLFALPEGIPLGALGWGMVPPMIPPIPAIPAHLQPRKPGQYLAGGWDPNITPGIAKRLKAAASGDIKGQQQKELDASGPSSLASVLGDEATNAKTADAFAKSGGVAPHGVLSDWAAGRQQAGAPEKDDESMVKGSAAGFDDGQNTQSDGTQRTEVADRSSTPNLHLGSGDGSDGARAAGDAANRHKDGSAIDETNPYSSLENEGSGNEGNRGIGVGTRRSNGGAGGADAKGAGTAQDDRIPSSDSTGILAASNSAVSDNLIKDRIQQLRGKSAYAEGLPKLGDVTDDPYPPLDGIPHGRSGAAEIHDYGNRTDGKWMFHEKSGFWMKGSASSSGIVDGAHQGGSMPVSSSAAGKSCLVRIHACSKPSYTLSDVEARVCTGRFRNGSALVVSPDTIAPKSLTREEILSGCLLFE